MGSPWQSTELMAVKSVVWYVVHPTILGLRYQYGDDDRIEGPFLTQPHRKCYYPATALYGLRYIPN